MRWCIYSPTTDNLLQTVIAKLTEKCKYANKSDHINMNVQATKEDIFLWHTADCLLNPFTWLKPHTVEIFFFFNSWWVLITKLCGVSAHFKDGTGHISKCTNITFYYRDKTHSIKWIETISVACLLAGNPLEVLSYLVYKTFQSQLTIVKATPDHVFHAMHSTEDALCSFHVV